MLLLLDNYDSFTYNLVQYFQELGQEVAVRLPDAFTVAEAVEMNPDYLVISPGPGTPGDAILSKELIMSFAGRIPILGVCLGHQCIAEVFGGKVLRAEKAIHGKTSLIEHTGRDLFRDCPSQLNVTRYHSLIVDEETLPACLQVTAWTAQKKEIMAIAHRELPIVGVQFHPESILSECGHKMLANFLSLRAANRTKQASCAWFRG